MVSTPPSLLERLRQSPDQAAWERFVELYTPLLFSWTRRLGLASHDAADLIQDIFTVLVEQLPTFSYDRTRSFRAWLKTVTHHAWHDIAVKNSRPGRGSGDTGAFAALDGIAVRDALARCLEDAYDEELLREAMGRVRLRVEPRTWDAFHLLAVEEVPGAEVARRLGMKVATVYVARSKVQRLLRDEIARLDAD